MSDMEKNDSQEERKEKHKPTDDEIGDFLLEKFKGNIRYFHSSWHRYQDGVWVPENSIQKEIWEQLKVLKHMGIRPSAGKVVSVEKYLEHYLAVDDDLIDKEHNYINLQNGLFNLTTGKLEKHRRNVWMTSQLPFSYDPDAECPNFERFMRTAFVKEDEHTPDYDLHMLLLEAMGYSLTSNTDFRVSFWLQGASNSGKSVMINILQKLSGNSYMSIDLNQLSQNPYQLADIAGKRVVTFSEAKVGGVLADDHYKRIVSQDTIMARQIFGKPFRFVPICKVWGAMNEMPRVMDRSDAVFNRIIIFPMNRVLPEEQRDLQLIDKVNTELSGIFNLALIGLKRLRHAGHFTRVEQCERARTRYKEENDTELAFVRECCDTSDTTAIIEGQKLYDAYAAWCRRNNAGAKTATRIARDWERLGFKKKRSNGTWWTGVKLNASGDAYV